MASVHTLIGETNNDFNEATNYDTGEIPTAGDTLHIPYGAFVITDNVDAATHALTHLTIITGPDFTGQIGTAANPLEMVNNAVETTLSFNSPLCKNFHLNADIGTAQVLNTHPSLGSITLQAPTGEAIDVLRVFGGTGLKLIDCAGTYASVIVDGPGALVTIENLSVACTALRVNSGTAKITGATTSAIAYDGTIELLGASKTHTLVEAHGAGAKIWFNGHLMTVTNCRISRGWGLANIGTKRITYTNTIEVESAGHFWAGGHCVFSGTPDVNAWGNADVRGVPDVTAKTLGSVGGAGA